MKASGCGVELSRNRSANQEAFVSHANATLTPITRLRLARLVVEGGWTHTAAETLPQSPRRPLEDVIGFLPGMAPQR